MNRQGCLFYKDNESELETKQRYIQANPRRWNLRDVPKGVFAQMRYKGNIDLLNYRGERLCLRISRKATEEEISRYSEKIAGFDCLVFSTFLSPGERACLQNLLYGKAKLV